MGSFLVSKPATRVGHVQVESLASRGSHLQHKYASWTDFRCLRGDVSKRRSAYKRTFDSGDPAWIASEAELEADLRIPCPDNCVHAP